MPNPFFAEKSFTAFSENGFTTFLKGEFHNIFREDVHTWGHCFVFFSIVQYLYCFSVPDYSKIDGELGEQIEAFKEMVYPVGYDPSKAIKKAPAPRRRLPSPDKDGYPTQKKHKVDASEVDMVQTANDGKVSGSLGRPP